MSGSRLPLTERLSRPLKQPKQLSSWSQIGNDYYPDTRALRYYYFPDSELDRDLNLGVGFSAYQKVPDTNQHLDGVLNAIMHLEKSSNQKIDSNMVTWRGILSRIIGISVDSRQDLDFNVVGFDGQIFMEIAFDEDQARDAQQVYPQKDKMIYSGYNFEKFTTLPGPWASCTREEIMGRYKGCYRKEGEYGILLRSGVGPIKVLYGAEVDCTEKWIDPKKPLSRYVELKTTKAIRNSRDAKNFEAKIFRSWLQCFLAGIPKIVYGFRGENYELCAVEEYKTSDLPQFLKNSRVTPPQNRWNGNDAIAFYAVFLAWMNDTVKDGHSYRLRYRAGSPYIELVEGKISVPGREVAFLPNEFVEWRRGLNRAKVESEAAPETN